MHVRGAAGALEDVGHGRPKLPQVVRGARGDDHAQDGIVELGRHAGKIEERRSGE
jgi:hypothetical protein